MSEIKFRQYAAAKFQGIPLDVSIAFDENGHALVKTNSGRYIPRLMGFDINVKYRVDGENIIIESVESNCLDEEIEEHYYPPEDSIEHINSLILEDNHLKEKMILKELNDAKKTN